MRKIVVVDSDDTNCHLLGEIAHACGWDMAGCANSVPEGLALLARVGADCLVTEFWFGGGETGLDLVAKAKGLLPDVRTIVFTGWSLDDVAEAAGERAARPDRLIRKPSSPGDLMAALSAMASPSDAVETCVSSIRAAS